MGKVEGEGTPLPRGEGPMEQPVVLSVVPVEQEQGLPSPTPGAEAGTKQPSGWRVLWQRLGWSGTAMGPADSRADLVAATPGTTPRGWGARLHHFLLPPPPARLPEFAHTPWDVWLVRGNGWLEEHLYRRLPASMGGRPGRGGQGQGLALLLPLLATWLAVNLIMLHYDRYAATTEFGAPVAVDCYSSFWQYKDGCGLDGIACTPFANSTLLFKCPATCGTSATGSAMMYANGTLGFGSLLVVGDNLVGYRGDSWLCESAIHAGAISGSVGGCGKVSLNGAASAFPSVPSNGKRAGVACWGVGGGFGIRDLAPLSPPRARAHSHRTPPPGQQHPRDDVAGL
jgi:hypothetical protein